PAVLFLLSPKRVGDARADTDVGRSGTTFPLHHRMPAPAKNSDLHGNVPDQCSVALILIDVISDMEFEDGEAIFANALPAARKLARLRRRAREARVPVIYVNDNFGKWRSDFRQQLGHVLEDGVRGQPIAELLRPDEDDYFVLKAKHSGFYDTQLDLLIEYLQVRTVVIAGFTTDICVLFTASDAYLRDLDIVIPPDCSAAATAEYHQQAMEHMTRVLHASVIPSTDIDFAELVDQSEQMEKAHQNG
ncbi:MAG TPA: cysteine hydrolase, partial [Gemmatimonadaceae bacterium]|nr:cysteine hydrolase [Gemmatimonadaceae bacterium]